MKIKLLKLATPLAAAMEVVLPLAKEAGPLNTANATVDEFDETTLPNVSSTNAVRAVPSA